MIQTINNSLIIKCERVIRELANDVSRSIKSNSEEQFLVYVSRKLKFKNAKDWIVLCSVMDLLNDTELAKQNYDQFELSGPTKISSIGEQYLRLYGIVNAIYLQKSAIASFIELVNLPYKKKIMETLNNLEVMQFRHIVGAHTVDFIENNKINPHQIQRYPLDGDIISTMDSDNKFKDFELKKLILEYNACVEELLVRATEKFVNSALKNGGEKLKQYLEKIELIKFELAGNTVVYNEIGEVTLKIAINYNLNNPKKTN